MESIQDQSGRCRCGRNTKRIICDECAKKELLEQGMTEQKITEKPKWTIEYPDTNQYELFDS